MATTLQVGIGELKLHLNEYLRRVKIGDTIIITKHGKMIGQIIPINPTLEKRLKSVVASGVAEWDGQQYQPKKSAARNRSRKQLSDLVIEDREANPPS
jgi:prevent-host-death family protein